MHIIIHQGNLKGADRMETQADRSRGEGGRGGGAHYNIFLNPCIVKELKWIDESDNNRHTVMFPLIVARCENSPRLLILN